MAPKDKKEKEAAKRAAELAERQRIAEEAFARADADGSGEVDEKELQLLISGLLQREKIEIAESAVSEFIANEFKEADTDGNGMVDFDEFIVYYNKLVDKMKNNGQMEEAIANAKQMAAQRAEEAAIAEDPLVYESLHYLLALLGAPSVRQYSGLVLPFTKLDDATNEHSKPNAEHGCTSRGLVLDLSRRAQRLLTPWGSLPLGYRLSFPGYQLRVPDEAEEGLDKTPKSKLALAKRYPPWPLIAPEPPPKKGDGPEYELSQTDASSSLFFLLGKQRLGADALLVLRKLPNRCHFQVAELLSVKMPRGEVQLLTAPSGKTKLVDRWAAQRKAHPKEPRLGPPPGAPSTAPPLDGSEKLDPAMTPIVNQLAQRCVVVHKEKLEVLQKKVAGGRKKYAIEDLQLALLACGNDPNAAQKMLVDMGRTENNLVDYRKGYSNREDVRHAMRIAKMDEEAAKYYLDEWDGEKQKAKAEANKARRNKILGMRGTASGIGFPTQDEVDALLVEKRSPDGGEEGRALAALKQRAKQDIECMVEILAAAEVEELLTPEMCEAFAVKVPCSAEDARHVEDMYMSDEFGRDKEKLRGFLTSAGTVLRKAQRLSPKRDEVEALLRVVNKELAAEAAAAAANPPPEPPPPAEGEEAEVDVVKVPKDEAAERVMKFLEARDDMMSEAPKQGKASLDDCSRYLHDCERAKEQAMELMKGIWKIAKAKPPAKKGAPFYAEECGFPSRDECEWALKATRKEGTPGRPLDLAKAVELLKRLSETEGLINELYPGATRQDVVWSLDVDREKRFKEAGARPIAGESIGTTILKGISHLVTAGRSSGLNFGNKELKEALESMRYDAEKAEKWLNGVGTLMTRKAELCILSREEVEHAMNYHELDDSKVIELFQEAAALQASKAEFDERGIATRDEIKTMLTLAWDEEDRVPTTKACLQTYCALMASEEELMVLFPGRTPDADERAYVRGAILKFKGDPKASGDYLRKVAEIIAKGAAVGNPSRERAIEELEKHNGSAQHAIRAMKEEENERRSVQAKAEYAKRKAAGIK